MRTELVEALRQINRGDGSQAEPERRNCYLRARELLGAGAPAGTARELRSSLEATLERPGERLIVYGSLAPGEVNHHIVAPVGGTWSAGTVRGHLRRMGWGTYIGFPALEWDPAGELVRVRILSASALPAHWERIDEFEGEDYQRILIPVETAAGAVVAANIYVTRPRA